MKEKIYESLRYKIRRLYYKYIRVLNEKEIKKLMEEIDPKLNYVALHNPNWLGITSSTKAIFKNTLAVEELYSKKELPLYVLEEWPLFKDYRKTDEYSNFKLAHPELFGVVTLETKSENPMENKEATQTIRTELKDTDLSKK
jgi:hypothetical protein